MTLTRAELELVAEELAPLEGVAAIQRVLEVDADTRLLRMRVPGETVLFLISLEPELTRAHVVTEKPQQPPRPSRFTMLLRKWVEGARLESVAMLNDDRILRFDLRVSDPEFDYDSGGEAPLVQIALVAELFGRNPNLYLLDANDNILGQQNDGALGERELGRGQSYELPPPPPSFSKGDTVRWSLDELPTEGFERSRLIEAHYAERETRLERENLRQTLESKLDRQLKRLERRIEHVHEDLSRAENADQFKRRGELLQSAWGQVEKGAESVEVPDFYEEGQPTVEIPLEPSKDLQENIEHYFHEYKRYNQAADRILERLETSESELAATRQAREALETLEGHEALAAFRDQLRSEGVLPKPKPKSISGRSGKRKPYRTFHAGSGAQILVGRGAADNDTVSTAVARGRDMWLHARDYAGAHVLLRMEKKQDSPHGEDLLDAATLAAWFSQGKKDTLVDVTYTKAKYVRKPKGFPPGRVTVADASTIAVRIEEDRLQRLLETED
jgi:predicted ribosome quality control (RQC) complex YloA/Tae2 family protein